MVRDWFITCLSAIQDLERQSVGVGDVVMSEPQSSIKIDLDDLKKADLAKKKSAELRAAIDSLERRLDGSEYPSRKEVTDLIDKLGKAGSTMAALGSW